MLKDHFQKSTSTLNILRSQHFKVSEYLNKGKYKLKKKLFSTGGKTKHHYDFDLNTQQFLHQEIDDIIFEQTEIQQIFYNQIHKSLEEPISYNNKIKIKDFGIGVRKNPSEVRVLLARHFHNRSVDLSYKKYQTLLRVHNLGEQQHLTAVKSRTNLIQKQIELCLNRQTRLEVQDYFEQSYTQGGKPRAGNENGKPIYKELDQQQCWFSNINRNDIQAYLRNILFREDILNNAYWPYWFRCEYIVFSHGLDLCKNIQAQFLDKKNKDKQNILNQAKLMIKKLEKGLEDLSQAGNLVQKQNLANFMYNITGINSQQPICIPIYPATYSELIQHYKKSTDTFFNNLPLSNHKQIIDMIPKLNSFCLIIFKYQNKQILEGKKQIKLGLEDEVDIKKQLITMLEQQWVTRYVTKIDFLRFQYKLEIKKIDWQMDEYSLRLEQENKLMNGNGYAPDSSLEQLIRAIRMTEYLQFRRIMKKRSEKVVNRVKTKYEDMFLVQKYFRKSEQQINMQKLSQIYNIKSVEQKQLKKGQVSEITKSLFDRIISVLLIKNPVEVEITETLTCVKIREIRTRILNICNGFRCYQRNIDMDLRVIDGCQFTFELDDDYLINSNKQVLEHFQKEIKETQTFISKAKSGNSLGPPSLQQQDFLIHKKLEKSMFYKKDKIKRQNYSKDSNPNNVIPHILVIDGKKKRKVLYNKSLEDLKLVQSRIMELGTHFINKYESVIKMKSLPEIVDRANVLCELFELQERYLYEKFNLIEAYYYLYENTVEPLNCHKIGKIILQLMYEVPKIDLNSGYYKFSYQTLIETLQTQTKIVKVYTKLLEDEQKEKNKVFHKKFAKVCQIPLTLWAYAYKDMQVKTAKNYSKLQRINSVSSKLSRNSKQSKEKQGITEIKDKINEQFGQDSDYEPEEFDIEKYDEYALRSMDQLFKDIVGDEQNNVKDKDAGLGTSSLGLDNITVNPKFQGGPHPLHNYLPRISITSEQQQKLLNFSQHICMVANIHQLIKKLTKQGRDRYGYCSHEYQLCLQKHICLMINKILHEQMAKVPQFHQFQTDDIYLQTVTKDMSTFESLMNPILFLPSKTQLSLHSTHQIHQRNYLSEFLQTKTLEKFDVNILSNLIKLEKPINTAVYRELNLSINLLEFVRLRQKIREIQYRRQQVFNAYRLLGQYNGFKLQKYEHCYSRSGLSNPTFQSLSEIKQYHENIKKLPSLNQSIEQLRNICELEQTQLKLFQSFVEMAKQQIQDYFRFLWNIEKQNCNKIVNRNSLLISLSKNNVDMVAKKVRNFVKIIAEDIFQNKSYLKYKLSIKNLIQQKIKIAYQTQIGDYILKHYLDNDTKKYSHVCYTILSQKIKKSIGQQYIKKYTKDLKNQLINNQTFLELTKSIKILKNYIVSLPYLSKIFTVPTEFQKLMKQKFDDQKKISVVDQKHQNVDQDIFYIYSKQQLIESWHEITQTIHSICVNQSINIEEYVKSTLPPDNKELIFKWMYNIPTNNINQNEKQALRHLLKVYQPFTGKISVSEYRYSLPSSGSRNKFSQLSNKYSILIEYIQSNLLIICLQVDDDILDSIFSIVDHGYKFEEKFPLKDEISIYENYSKEGQKQAQYMKDSVLAPCFLYENKKDELEKKLKTKLSSRGYSTDKNGVRYSIIDQITDFIVSKVQGYGVFRQSMIEMKDQIELFKKMKPELGVNYMKSKTRNIYNLMWLSLWENYNSKNDPKTNLYTPIYLDQLLSRPKLEILKTPLCKNTWRGLSRQIQSDLQAQEQQKLKFHKGIYDLKTDLLTSKLKIAHNFIPLDYNQICQRYIYKSENQNHEKQAGNKDSLYISRHNWQNFESMKQIIKKPGEKFRFELFGRLRDQFQKGKNFIKTKTDSSSLSTLMQMQQKKQAYFQYQTHAKINMIALTAFKLAKPECFPDNASKFAEEFNKILVNNKEKVQYNAFNIYDQLEAYQNNGKIIFSKTQNGLMVKGPMSFQAIQHSNKLVRNIIFSKLTTEELKNQILQVAIKLLKSQNLRKNDKKGDSKHDTKMQPKKVQNQSYLPRVHLISSFSSPLIIERKTYISQQHKLAFVQAFINRFRNKVSRVDLLSSGFGFVITVPDLEDCLNYMNKLLFTFTEKEFKSRLDTFSQYFQILRDGIKQRDEKIVEQAQIIKYLQDKLKNTIQADYLSKVSKLLQQKYLIEQKLTLAQQAANGLQHRVRKAVQYEYDSRITSLQKQNKYLRDQFQKFKDIFIKLTKDQTKNNFLTLVNQLKQKVSKTLDKKIDLSESFAQIRQINIGSPQKRVKVKQQEIKISNSIQNDKQYGQEDIQSCKIGQDIIHDPYYVTKLINKMRLFNLFKMGSKRIKYDNIEQKRVKQLTSLHKIQDRVVVQTEKQYQVQKQFIIKNQQNSIKQKQLEITKQALSTLSNQKQKLKQQLIVKQKKLEQKQREIQEYKKYKLEYERLTNQHQGLKKNRNQSRQSRKLEYTSQQIRQQKKQEYKSSDKKSEKQELTKLSNVRHHKKSIKYMDPDVKSFLTSIQERSAPRSLYQNFELSNKDSTWREKCQQLYLENRKLQNQMQQFKRKGKDNNERPTGTTTPVKKQGYSLNMRNKRSVQGSEKDSNMSDRIRFPNASYKYSIMKE